MKTIVIRGVPRRLQQDGWWLSPPPGDAAPKPAAECQIAALAVLILCAQGVLSFGGAVAALALVALAGHRGFRPARTRTSLTQRSTEQGPRP